MNIYRMNKNALKNLRGYGGMSILKELKATEKMMRNQYKILSFLLNHKYGWTTTPDSLKKLDKVGK